MKQEDKDLLIKDLSARLPYGVKAYIKHWSKLDRKYYEGVYTVGSVYPSLNDIYAYAENGSVEVILGYDDYEFKPYLFPISSMTEEQKKEFISVAGYEANEEDCGLHTETYYYDMVGHEDKLYANYEAIDWLIKNHFDYRGLIPSGLAIAVTEENNPYKS